MWKLIVRYHQNNNRTHDTPTVLLWSRTLRTGCTAPQDKTWSLCFESTQHTWKVFCFWSWNCTRSINLTRFTFLGPGSLFLRNKLYWIHEGPSKSVQVSSCSWNDSWWHYEHTWYMNSSTFNTNSMDTGHCRYKFNAITETLHVYNLGIFCFVVRVGDLGCHVQRIGTWNKNHENKYSHNNTLDIWFRPNLVCENQQSYELYQGIHRDGNFGWSWN